MKTILNCTMIFLAVSCCKSEQRAEPFPANMARYEEISPILLIRTNDSPARACPHCGWHAGDATNSSFKASDQDSAMPIF